jgi:hypothetical protein
VRVEEGKGTRKESVVGEIKREGLEAEGLKGVNMGHRRGRDKCRKEQRTKSEDEPMG